MSSSLTSVRIPSSVKKMRFGVFDGCSNLKEIYFPSGISMPDKETKNILDEPKYTYACYDPKRTKIVVDPTKFD